VKWDHSVNCEENPVNRRLATVCLLVILAFALGLSPLGSAAVHLVIPANSVGTVQLKNGAVTAAKIRRGSLTASLFASGRLPAGPAGPPGPAGPVGPAGPAATAATLGLQFVGGESGFDASSPKSATATCPAGKRAVSWAFQIQLVTSANPNAAPGITAITPNDFDVASGRLPGGYTVKAETFGFYPDSWKLFAYVTCVTS
jgi:hypothetical protein